MILTTKQLDSLTEQLYSKWGQDFRNYSAEALERRVQHSMVVQKFNSFDRFMVHVLSDGDAFRQLLQHISVNVTSMFRNPDVYRYLRESIIPKLASYPRIRIWSAGIATGAEPWSLAILLAEAGLLDRSLIYATDFNPEMVRQSTQGAFSLESMVDNTRNYIDSGGRESFSNYYSTSGNMAYLDESLKQNIIFSTHNLVTDGVFNEFQLILCRNVLIYFNRSLTNHAVSMFDKSISNRGYLVLGLHETLRFHDAGKYFESIHEQHKVYQKL